jgi:S1-C subfamily serine protease
MVKKVIVKKDVLKLVSFIIIVGTVFWFSSSVQTRGIGVLLDEVLPTNGGVYIQDVYQNSPAFKAGLKRMDRVINIYGKQIVRVADFIEAIRSVPASQPTVKIEFHRGDSALQEVNVELVDIETFETSIVP